MALNNDPTLPQAASLHRRQRSFVVRAGRMGTGQARALRELSPKYVLPFEAHLLNLTTAYERSAPTMVEIGFGMGHATANWAAAHPQFNVLGIEVHPPGVGALLQRIESDALRNVRIVQHDAVEVFESMLGPQSLQAVHILFPDPWPKKRHHKRRLIQPEFVSLVASRLAEGGSLHLATDWEPYALHMLDVLQAQPTMRNQHEGFAPRNDQRIVTRFEHRGLALGHQVFDLTFVKT
jgi:tRNA (guanine-N7-)-methyltransferase